MKKLLALLALATSAFAANQPVTLQKDPVSQILVTGGFKVGSGQTVEFQSGSVLTIDSGTTFTFPAGSIAWSAITGTPTTLSGYGITNGQVLNANLTAISGLASAANTFPVFTGSGTATLGTVTSFGLSLLADTNAAGGQATLGVTIGTNVQAFSSVLNQVAAGTYPGATSITTVGTITTGTWNGTAISLTAGVSGVLPVTNGGTGNAFFTVAGPATSPKTYTFPNANANVLTDNALVTPAQGGSGVNNSSFTETRAGNISFAGAYSQTFTALANSSVVLPVSGTLATLAGTESLTNKTVNGMSLSPQSVGFALSGGTTSKTFTVSSTLTLTAGSDGETLNIGPGGTLGSAAFVGTGTFEVPLTFSTGLTRTVNTVAVNTSQNIATLSNLSSNGIVQTSGGVGTLSINSPTGSGAVVEATAPTIAGGVHTGITNFALRDTSAAFDLTVGATSSTPLTAGRSLTIDVVNVSRILQLTGNAVLNQDVSSTGSPTFANPVVTTLVLGATTPGIISGASGAITLTGAGTNQNIRLAPSGTGAVVINVGAAATPSLAFTGDTTTGIYQPGASQIGVSIAGTSIGSFTSTGLNGMALGATTPSTASVTTLGASGAVSFTSTLGVTGTLTGAAATFSSTLGVTGHTTFEGVTSTGATGTGNLVYSASPTLTGTIAGASETLSGTLAVTGHVTLEGVTSTGATGTGNLVYSGAPTFTGTLNAATAVLSGTLSVTGHTTFEGVTSTGATGTGNLAYSASPTFTGTLTAAAVTDTGNLGVGGTFAITGNVVSNLNVAGWNVHTTGGGELISDNTIIVGQAGTGSTPSTLTVAGSTAGGYGPVINLNAGSSTVGSIGTLSGVTGGGSTQSDIAIYAFSTNTVDIYTGGALTAQFGSGNSTIKGSLTVASGQTFQLGSTYLASTYTTATGSVDLKDAAGTVYHVLVHN